MIHSLQQFYAMGQALIAKYGIDPEAYENFEAEIDLANGNKLDCKLRLTKGHDWLAYGFGPSPEIALGKFERDLQNGRGRVLDDFTFEVPQEESHVDHSQN